MQSLFTKRTIYTLISAAIILTGTIIAIQYAKGGFRRTDEGFADGTGLLAANSFPSGAEVYVDGVLMTATDDTIYLTPNEYLVEISKDGFKPWSKRVVIQQELVVQTNATLFPVAPSLTNLTFSGVQNLSPSPDGQKIVYYSASASAQRKNGLYVLELSNSPLPIQRGPRQIAEDTGLVDFSSTHMIWSPDSSEILLVDNNRSLLLDSGSMNELGRLENVAFQQEQILSEWQEEMYIRERQFLGQFPDEVVAMATQSAKNVYISPDKKRLLYTATESFTLPDELVPPVPSKNTQPESRALEPGSIYVYDREEDLNFLVGTEASVSARLQPFTSEDLASRTPKALLANDLYSNSALTLEASPSAFTTLQASESAQTASNFNTYHTSLYATTYQWFPDSKHLLYLEDGQLMVMEYDGANKTTIYSGPFDPSFLYPWPDGGRLLIVTSFSPQAPDNLYAIELR